MKTKRTILLITIIFFAIFSEISLGILPAPFDTYPYDTKGAGNCARRSSGGYFYRDGIDKNIIYWVGTNLYPGSLTLFFDTPFIDGPGNDFAIRTSSETWGDLADMAKFEFYRGTNLVGYFSTDNLMPDDIFEFELPGNSIIADRIVITNITPDPPGVNELATMAFIDAGVAYPVPEPGTSVLLGLGALLIRKRRQ